MQSFKQFITEREVAAPVKGETIHGLHYSHKEGLTSLDGRIYGTGIKGAEAKRLSETKDARIKSRVYFYHANEGEKVSKVHESGLGQHTYSAKLHNMYNPDTASQEHAKEVRETAAKHVYNGEDHGNAFERAVVDHGYSGYVNRGMAVVLNHHDVPVHYEGKRSELMKATA
jgi:hypothetical protein